MEKIKTFLAVIGAIGIIAAIVITLHYGAYTTNRDNAALNQWCYEHAVRP